MAGILKTTEVYGSKNYVAFEEEISKNRYFSDRIESYGVIQFGAINAGQTRQIDLAEKGLICPVSIKSVYAFSGDTSNDQIDFYIYDKTNIGSLVRIANQTFSNSEMPYKFPDGAIVFPGHVIEVKPRYTVEKLLIYCKPVDVIFTLQA